jgi:hypothetical protein
MELVISLSSDLPENTPHLSYKDQSVCLEETSNHGNEPSGSIKGGEFID